ncbi:MAG: hypothetical protein RIG27_14745, partial [Coleofasciculus sp. F4-SAH-05]
TFFNFKKIMLARIIEEFKKVKDFRNKRGKRHELWVVLSIIFLGLMTVKRNQIKLYNSLKELTERESPVSEYEKKDVSRASAK